MNWILFLYVIWNWTPESFIGVWKLKSENNFNYINMMPGGLLKLIGGNDASGYWEKTNNELMFTISHFGNWKLYNGNVHRINQTNTTIQGQVLSGQTDPYYEGDFVIEPLFLQFHDIKYETKTENYYDETSFYGYWILENTQLTSNYKTEKSGNKMRRHVIKKIVKQEDSKTIHLILLNENKTWSFCNSDFKPINIKFQGTWGLYNDTDNINFNSIVKHQSCKGIWLKSNTFEKVYIVTNSIGFNFSSELSGILVHSYEFEPYVDDSFFMRKI